jgi:hypothetical protein
VQPEAQRIRIKPANQPMQLHYILEALTKVINYGRWPIDAILRTEATHLPYGASVVVVTATTSYNLQQSLLELRRRELGITIVTLGDKSDKVMLPGIRHYHIGGRKEWDELESLTLA